MKLCVLVGSLSLILLTVYGNSHRATTVGDLAQLFDDYWDYEMKHDPFSATGSGVYEYNDKVPAVSLESRGAIRRARFVFKERLGAIDLSEVSANDQLSAKVLGFILDYAIEFSKFGSERIPFVSDSGFNNHFGRLSYEMWRACRLVVDTGLHAMGWSRQQAVDYLPVNTALSFHEIGTEVDRYIAWPGQALAYKMGEITLWDLRAEAEAALGDAFDIRDFHDAVLAKGGVTLGILSSEIKNYIRRIKSAK